MQYASVSLDVVIIYFVFPTRRFFNSLTRTTIDWFLICSFPILSCSNNNDLRIVATVRRSREESVCLLKELGFDFVVLAGAAVLFGSFVRRIKLICARLFFCNRSDRIGVRLSRCCSLKLRSSSPCVKFFLSNFSNCSSTTSVTATSSNYICVCVGSVYISTRASLYIAFTMTKPGHVLRISVTHAITCDDDDDCGSWRTNCAVYFIFILVYLPASPNQPTRWWILS